MLAIRRSSLALASFFLGSLALGAGTIANWPAPATWSPSRAAGVRTLSDIGGPNPFIAVTPCRIADTRGNGFTGSYGPPSLVANANRTFVITGQCDIPATAQAVSLNFGALNVGGAGDLRVFPAGGSVPLVSTMNYNAGTPNIANAAVVPIGAGGGITVRADAVSIDLIIDTNGYYGPIPASGAGLILSTNTPGHILAGSNTSATCTGACGLYSQVDSSAAGANAMQAYASSTGGPNFGVVGFAAGTEHSLQFDIGNSAGVYGEALSSDRTVNGVLGKVSSSATNACGVLGVSDVKWASAIGFVNGGNGILGNLGSSGFSADYGLWTNGHILGSNVAATVQIGSVSPHPTDPASQIRYLAVEAPTADMYFRGTARLSDGYARIDVPEHFRVTARGDSYMTTVTPVGSRASLFVEAEGPDGIEVRGAGNVAFHYVVWAERDALRGHQAVERNTIYTPEALTRINALAKLPEFYRKVLISNGTLNPDGTFNPATAERLGWTIPEPSRVIETPAAPQPNKD